MAETATEGLSAARLAEIEARCAATTPGPWTDWAAYVYAGGPNGANVLAASEPRASVMVGYTPPQIGSPALAEAYANAAFAAHARTDVPDLVTEVRRLRAGLAACRAVIETCDWTGPYAELNAARRACGLPEV